MKTTLDLPESLVREMKLRAAQEGRKLKDVAAEVFERGLSAQPPPPRRRPYTQTLDTPIFACEESNAVATSMSVEQLLKLEQQAQHEEDFNRVSGSL
ncbi:MULTISPECIES: antitoxin [unclassified Lentimonas]|uniref:antitoxin n=1 Tax=unclassified Lentimonas TaxID=2630993 RepID=UPI001322C538|nr:MULTISPECIES: antitoxin [unclassified Lentimonas]CAA6691149.1 Unannotated [Lentimonas sp. CC10]CAA6693747.1 Unannotated [Lentimonas sp. CC19]CAA7070117.1 Unannotated [Lentimonas sp. CC11]